MIIRLRVSAPELPAPARTVAERDERLLALAWQAVTGGVREIVLDEKTIRSLAGDGPAQMRAVPPPVELAARIHALSLDALQHGQYTLTVAPARAAGTLTSRFTPMATGSGLEELYRAAPAGTDGALPVQMSFPPVYPHAENVCRVPAYLPHVLPLGEHRPVGEDSEVVALADLAVTATRDRLHLVSVSRGRVVEPQVFHALALEKQPPPLARFLAHLPRAFTARWHEFDWGPHAHRMPFLPRVRYRRTILAPGRWRLTTNDLPPEPAGETAWRQALTRWRERWHCPATVELRDADRTLRLTLDEPAHAAVLHAHLTQHRDATLTETAAGAADFGWLGGHVHELALPLVTTRPAAPTPLRGPLPQVRNATHGQPPGAPGTRWLYAKIHAHPERHSEIITEDLPRLLDGLGGEPAWWFVRYRSPQETDHLRLRIRTEDPERYGMVAAAVGQWAQQLRHGQGAGRLVLDTYHPETGRYGHGGVLEAAEAVFAADSSAVAAALRHLPAPVIHPTALAAVNMVDIAHGFLGNPAEAMEWLATRPAPASHGPKRSIADEAIRIIRSGPLRDLSVWPGEVATAWRARAAALGAYRATLLPPDADTDAVLESLLHMHHNRAIGIDRDSERACRRLARNTALAWRAQQSQGALR